MPRDVFYEAFQFQTMKLKGTGHVGIKRPRTLVEIGILDVDKQCKTDYSKMCYPMHAHWI